MLKLKKWPEIIRTYVTENLCEICKKNNTEDGVWTVDCKNCVLMKCLRRMDIEHKLLIAVVYILGLLAVIGLFGLSLSVRVSFGAMLITVIWAFNVFLVYLCVCLIRELKDGEKNEHN